jgi:hypothetical protein
VISIARQSAIMYLATCATWWLIPRGADRLMDVRALVEGPQQHETPIATRQADLTPTA